MVDVFSVVEGVVEGCCCFGVTFYVRHSVAREREREGCEASGPPTLPLLEGVES